MSAPKASIDQLRRAVTDLAEKGKASVGAVRSAFVAGTAPVQTASSGSAADFVTRFGGVGVSAQIATSTSRLGLLTANPGTTPRPPRPELDHVEVGHDRAVGVLDSFFARVVVSLPLGDLSRANTIRVLRASNGPVAGVRKPNFSAMIDSMPLRAGSKNQDPIALAAFAVDRVGVGNQLTSLVADDAFADQRSAVSSGSLRAPLARANTNRGVTSAGLVSLAADRSVIENVDFYVNRRTLDPQPAPANPLSVGIRTGINVLQGSAVGSSTTFSPVGNGQEFREVARIAIAPSSYVTIGSFAEFEYVDPSVVFGGSYTYYAVCSDRDGNDGPRSRLVRAEIVKRSPPAAPHVLFGVIAGRPRFSIRCSGSFVDRVEVFRKGGRSFAEAHNGFLHVTDVGTGGDRSATFTDADVSPGQRLDYRFYAVDSFGVKSGTPFSCSISLPDHGSTIPLTLPSITAEQDRGGRNVRVTVGSDDPRVTSFVVTRKDLSTNDISMRQSTTPDYFTLGRTSAKRGRSRSGPALSQYSSKAWTGVLPCVSGSAQMSDLSVEFDRSYQYSVRSVDLRGNVSSDVRSQPLLVTVKPVSDAPVSLSGTVIADDGGTPSLVRLHWTVGTNDFPPQDLIGDQDVLNATIQRSVFQVERRRVGEAVWQPLPAVTGDTFDDVVSSREAPSYRPPYARAGLEYDYRVIAMQSGGFLSTYTDPLRIPVVPEVFSPGTLWVRSTDTAVRPLHAVLSWQYEGEFVDGWDIERAAVNKVFAAKLVSVDSRDVQGLAFSRIAEVKRESSRTTSGDRTVYVGNHAYVDTDVDMANSYYYRIRAVDLAGRASAWSYGGVSLTDSPHDRKFFSVLSDDERVALAGDPRPIVKWRPL